MIDSFTFIGESSEDMNTQVVCETKEGKRCPFTGGLFAVVEQKKFEPNFEADFMAWYDGLSDEEHKSIQEGI